jgi:hypothetical protein
MSPMGDGHYEDFLMTEPAPCAKCGGKGEYNGAFNSLDYLKCSRCGYEWDHFEEDGIVFDIEGGLDRDEFDKRVDEIRARHGK